MRQIPLLFIAIILFPSCTSQHTNDNGYNDTFIIGQIPDLKSFETYNEFDKRIDSVGNSLAGQGGFRKNRTRLFMQSFSNGKQSTQDSALYTGMPTLCYCSFDKDTLNVKVGIGFFGGMGFETKIFKNHFQSNYFLYIDDVKPYKYTLFDKDFTDNLYLKNKFQSLVLNEQPTFKAGQQLTGYLTFTSSKWYENSFGDNIDTNYIKGRLYFTCLTK
jgi:hypothetical protein